MCDNSDKVCYSMGLGEYMGQKEEEAVLSPLSLRRPPVGGGSAGGGRASPWSYILGGVWAGGGRGTGGGGVAATPLGWVAAITGPQWNSQKIL